MRKRAIIMVLLTAILLISANATATSKSWIALDGMAGPIAPTSTVLSSDDQETNLVVDIHGFFASDSTEEGVIYQQLALPGHFTTLEIGKPEMPVVTLMVAVPGDKNVTVSVTSFADTVLGDYNVYPFQTPYFEDDTTSVFEFDTATYQIDGFFPTTMAEVGEPGIWRDLRVIPLQIMPIQHNPVTDEIRVMTSVAVKLEYDGVSNKSVLPPRTWPVAESYNSMYSSSVINYADLNLPVETPGNKSGNYDYLIIAGDDWVDNMTPFVNYKNSIGLATQITALSTLGTEPTTVDIRDYIRQEYAANNIKYVLFVGELSEIPSDSTIIHPEPTETYVYSDYWYALMDDEDNYADLAVGRFAADSDLDVDQMISKSINFESAPPLDNWLNSALLIADKDKSSFWNCKNDVFNAVYTPFHDYRVLYPFFTKVYGHLGGTNNDIADAINAGQRVVNYRGHGTGGSWPIWNLASETFGTTEIQALDNGARTSIVLSIACSTNRLQLDYLETMGERFTEQSEGAAAFLGASTRSYRSTNNTYDKRIFAAIYDEGVNAIGDASNLGAIRILNNHGYSGLVNAFTYIWLGDPSLQVIYEDYESRLIWVSPIGDDVSGDGTRQSPYQTIGRGIESAQDNDIVMVRPGTYAGTGNRDLSFMGKSILVVSELGPEATVIDCENLGRAFAFENGELSLAVLNGFTLVNGNATNLFPPWGGAIYVAETTDSNQIFPSSPTITNCVIHGCQADKGGAASVNFVCRPIFENCTIVNNSADEGGGIYYNNAGSTAEVNYCVIAQNSGGGIWSSGPHGDLSYECNVFWENDSGNVIGMDNSGVDNLEADPQFCDADGGDYRFGVYSPCRIENSHCGVFIGAIESGCGIQDHPDRGDLNLNGVAFEDDDYLLYRQWFDDGDQVFTMAPDSQIAATDINCDGFFLTAEDFARMRLIMRGAESESCPGFDPMVISTDTLKVIDTSANAGTIRQGVDFYLRNGNVAAQSGWVMALQAKLTYNFRALTPHWDPTFNDGVHVEYELRGRAASGIDDFSNGTVIVKSETPGELLIYFLPRTDYTVTGWDIYDIIMSGAGPILRVFFDVADGIVVPPTTYFDFVDDGYNVNHEGYFGEGLPIIPTTERGTFSAISNPSCPVLYVYDGDKFVQENPLLTACEQSGYEETVTDYYQPITTPTESNGIVRFQLRELEEEVTFLESVELISVEHPCDMEVGCTVDGRVFVHGQGIEPIAAVDQSGVDRLASLREQDGVFFTASESGHLVVTFPYTENEVVVSLTSGRKGFCPGGEPLLKTDQNAASQPSFVTVSVQGADGAWRETQAAPPRDNLEAEFVVAVNSENEIDGGTVKLRIAWAGAYATDAVRLAAASAENLSTTAHGVSQASITSGSTSKRWAGFDPEKPMVLNQGDVFDFAFKVGSPPAERMSRDYIIKAVGRYMPKYLVDHGELPGNFRLYPNYPNPFNPATTISYDLPKAADVKLEIINLLGQRVAVLTDKYQEAGHYSVRWDGSSATSQASASGVYFYRLVAGDLTQTRKMVLLK